MLVASVSSRLISHWTDRPPSFGLRQRPDLLRPVLVVKTGRVERDGQDAFRRSRRAPANLKRLWINTADPTFEAKPLDWVIGQPRPDFPSVELHPAPTADTVE